jgi:hypothetical protein
MEKDTKEPRRKANFLAFKGKRVFLLYTKK